ncbi:LysM peptidoglycan-binding domain-containing protein [Pseudenhygromyxa sp. WMMC2535]|uniref:transglycosylase SLT domain-containing protein n=1 Tax=Pseudenhygromyxa sp. WMMC2535 TaxID=2712867 RepID=UPI0015572A11|nr:transglycosylase SLT domain-containing protein [Pseudenhygromyxa sp. WMMC2535]NVB40836.1 LysM peptidoglycan-binding domain-containing protein [Pseudenhygromyxa sp. WMMC2535]
MDPLMLRPSPLRASARAGRRGHGSPLAWLQPATRSLRPAGLSLALAWVLATPATSHATPTDDQAQSDAPQLGLRRIGPDGRPERAVWVNERARMRVRGDRPEGASIHVAYATPIRVWDEALRVDLAAFEDQAFPAGQVPRKTIVDEPPEAWMRKLELPDVPVRWNAKTIEYLEYFKNDPKGQRMIAAWLNRMGRYERRLRTILAEVGVPEDLVYVAMIESGFNPGAHSSVGAAGMWQFMEPTGRVYGLDSQYWADDRLDFEKASYAAATYLADLKARFGTWELALAAYNAGYGLVVQSIRANNTNNFWALTELENGLPRQTSNYVPKFLAAAIVGHNREAFGVAGKPDPALELIDVEVPGGLRFEELAEALEVDEDLLTEVNAAYLRGRTPPEGGPATIRIPRDKHARFSGLGDSLRFDEQRWATYTTKLGEDLEDVAAAYGITEKQLRSLNAIHDSGEIKSGIALVVPATPGEAATGDKPKPPLIAVPSVAVPAGRQLVFFRVTRASSSAAIAAGFGVAWDQVVAWNDLDPHARLVDGQFLQIIVETGFDAAAAGLEIWKLADVRHVVRGSAAHLDALLADRELLRRGYKVSKGDTVKRVAKRFGLSQGSLARINGIDRNQHLEPGEVLVVYVDRGNKQGTVSAPDPRPTTLTAELDVAESLAPQDRETDTATPRGRDPSTAERSRVPGKRYDD